MTGYLKTTAVSENHSHLSLSARAYISTGRKYVLSNKLHFNILVMRSVLHLEL